MSFCEQRFSGSLFGRGLLLRASHSSGCALVHALLSEIRETEVSH